jgi:hypothetical protein
MNAYQSTVCRMELILIKSIILPVTASVEFLEHTVKEMQMIASEILVYLEDSYIYFFYYYFCESIFNSKYLRLTVKGKLIKFILIILLYKTRA